MNTQIKLRKAQKADEKIIRKIIHEANINPLALHWQHFILAVDENDRVVGTGQIKTHYDGTRELASIAVIPAFQGKGIASSIIERLMAENPPPLFLTCRASLGLFYCKFGFAPLAQSDLAGYFARLLRIGNLFRKIGLTHDGMLVMGKFK
jgi:N-acetylglutamate synthase-like GNAT family acetyltransferase